MEKQERKENTLDHLLIKAKNGDQEAREKLISQYQPFILNAAAEVCGRYLAMGQDDETTISLMAFNEAIDSYDSEKQAAFLSFAKTVIKRRLIDYFRRQSHKEREVVASSFIDQDEEKETQSWELKEAEEAFRERQITYERREEILHFQMKLSEMGLTLQDIVKSSPKHEDARRRAMEVAGVIAANPLYREYLLQKKSIPIKSLEKEVDCSSKTLERQRKYIIAISLILMGDYHYIRDYVKLPTK
jgi:RNA polymerase sigma factor